MKPIENLVCKLDGYEDEYAFVKTTMYVDGSVDTVYIEQLNTDLGDYYLHNLETDSLYLIKTKDFDVSKAKFFLPNKDLKIDTEIILSTLDSIKKGE